MSVNQEDILRSAREEVERLLAELGRLGGVSEQQEQARDGLSKAAEALRGAGSRFESVLALLGQVGEALGALEATKISARLNDLEARLSALENGINGIQSEILRVDAAVGASRDKLATEMAEGFGRMSDSVMRRLEDASASSGKALAAAEECRKRAELDSQSRLDSLQTKSEAIEAQQGKLRTLLVATMIIAALAVLAPIALRFAG